SPHPRRVFSNASPHRSRGCTEVINGFSATLPSAMRGGVREHPARVRAQGGGVPGVLVSRDGRRLSGPAGIEGRPVENPDCRESRVWDGRVTRR
ncbi:MAG: hypothetical protein NUV93_00575, partial [Firmicutes bacterium]|nr:hypothetical protein [Bacillota bacterium]